MNRNPDGSRSDTTNRIWVVRDATSHSTLNDILWESDPYHLACIIVGAGGPQVVQAENWTFYTSKFRALPAAQERLDAVRAKAGVR